MKTRIAHALLASAMVCSLAPALAQAPAALATQAQTALSQEQERLRSEQEGARWPIKPSGMDLGAVQPATPTTIAPGTCQDVKTITVTGANHMPVPARTALARRYTGRCLGSSDVEQLLSDITQHYSSRGFITTQAYLATQDLSSGALLVLVQEGRIERLELMGGQRIKLSSVVPAKAGDLLNIRDLEQAVDQINSTPGNNVTFKLQSGSKPGLSVVRFINKARKPYAIQTSLDNHGGSSAIGRYNTGVTLTTGGLLGMNETLSLTLRSITPDSNPSAARSAGFKLQVPLGYNTVGLNASRSELTLGVATPGRQTPIVVSGDANTVGLSFNRLVYRNQASRHTITSSVSRTQSRLFVGDPWGLTSNYTNDAVTLGMSSVWALNGGTTLTFEPQIEMGQQRWAASALLLPATQRPNDAYGSLTLAAHLEKPLQLLQRDWLWRSTFKGQYAPDTLYNAQSLSMGGPNAVRGFSANAIRSDNGFYWRNELVYQQQIQLAGAPLKLDWYTGYDYGNANTRGALSSAVLGVAGQSGAWRLDMSYTHILLNPVQNNIWREPRGQLWFRATSTF